MAFPTPVNSQITDSVTQANLMVLGVAPALAAGILYQGIAQALANAAANATVAQQQGNTLFTAITARGCSLILGKPPSTSSGGGNS